MTVHHSCWIVYILIEYYTSREKLDGYMISYMNAQIDTYKYTHTQREREIHIFVSMLCKILQGKRWKNINMKCYERSKLMWNKLNSKAVGI